MEALSPGNRIDDDLILVERLGSGGLAEVWLARDEASGERRVVKLARPDAGPEAARLLERELEMARRLDHPSAVRVLGLRRAGDRPYLVEEHVDGADVGILRGRPAAEIVRALIPIADALAHAHRRGVVHRDVKVSNVLCDARGRSCLVDFGVAAASEGEAAPLQGGGSPFSMSPQQRAGEPARPADDLYGFGALLYELLTGRPPFWPEATEERVRSEEPAPLAAAFPIPERLAGLVSRLLAKSPDGRPRDMDEVKAALEEVARELASSPPPPGAGARPPVRLTPPPRVSAVEPALPASLRPAARKAVAPDRTFRLLTAAGFGGLALAALFVFLYLPRWIAQRPPQAPPRASEAARPAATPAPSEPSPDAAQRAQDALVRAGALRQRAEAMGAAVWGGPEWAEALRRFAAGDAALGRLEHARAAGEYEGAASSLEALVARAPEELRRALAAGDAALVAGDAAAARSAFERARAVDAGNAAAALGLKRAAALDEVLERVAAGAESERRGDLTAAARAYREALALDPHTDGARRALARVERTLADDALSRALAEALEAVEAGDWPRARLALGRAEKARPGTARGAELLARVEEGERRDAIAAHRRRAESAEAGEKWRAALGHYEAVLTLDPTIRFAQEGRARTRERAELAERLAGYLARPERLSAEGVLREAELALVAAGEVSPAGPAHRQQVSRLRELVAGYSTPVEVVLESDERTEVTVYRVGRLGAFRRRALELRPGTYTVVGSRSGYRDVRKELVVEAGEAPEPLVVRCEEPI